MKTKTILAAFCIVALGFSLWRWGLPALQRDGSPSHQGAEAPFCKEHGVPEAECAICHPELVKKAPASTAETALRATEGASEKEGAGDVVCETEKIKIRFASPEVAKAAGIITVEARAGQLTEKVHANGRVVFDGTRTAHLAGRIPGVIREFLKDLGQEVEAGEALVVIDSMDLGESESEYLAALAAVDLARKNAERERALAERSATSQKELLTAEAEYGAAEARFSLVQDRLKNLGVDDDEIERLRKERKISSRLVMTAPFAGTIVEREGTIGELTDPAKTLVTLTDLSRVWILLDIFEKDVARVEVGQKATFIADAYPDKSFRGTLTWISSQVDPETRTLAARMEVKNQGRLLKANFFGKATVSVREEAEALTVPKEAVQWEGCHNVVFVPLQEGQYQTRKVQLGYAGDGFYEVTEGLLAGERVVTTGSFLLKTEILKGSIGAG